MAGKHREFPAARAGRLMGRFRSLVNPPVRLLGRFIQKGDTVLDLGCGPGYFSLPIARLVGAGGMVIAADVQEEMLEHLRRAAEEEGLLSRMRLHRTRSDSLDLEMPPIVSFTLAFHVLHETGDIERMLSEIFRITRPGGLLLIAEPCFPVGANEFDETASAAIRADFTGLESPPILFSRAALLRK